MAGKVHGRKAFFSLTDVGAVVRDISNALNNVDYPETIDTAETSGFGDDDKTFVIGLKTRTIRIAGNWKGDANDVDAILSGLAGGGADGTVFTSYVYGPAGDANGEVEYTGTAILTNYSKSSPIGGVVTFSADFQCTGAHVRGVFGS